jgi:DNA-binding transcriptional LysR family regulator
LSRSRLPDFEGLAIFAKGAEEGSFAAAAQAIGVSVATVSRAVTRLEERLGGRLFNRTSRRLALTDYGHTLAERASKICADAEEAEDFARFWACSSAQLLPSILATRHIIHVNP